MRNAIVVVLSIFLLGSIVPAQQEPGVAPSTYQPKFAGDKAHSDVEAGALGYMRTVVSAQKVYKKKHTKYATSLMELVGSGSFTRRMAEPNRGDYTVHFKPKTDGYTLALTPKQFDASHRAFYVDETGVFRGESDKAATATSPVLE